MEKENVNVQVNKEDTKAYRDNISARLQEIKAAGIPFIVLVEGWDTAGKGYLINELIKSIDPRFYNVYVEDGGEGFERYPFLYRYYQSMPANGTFRFMDGGYMESTVDDCLKGKLSKKQYEERIQSINNYERTLINNGYVVLKMFLDISEKEQKSRLEELASNKKSAWRVKKADRFQNANYKAFKKSYETFMKDTNEFSQWVILDAKKQSELKFNAFKLLSDTIDNALANGKFIGKPYEEKFKMAKTVKLSEIPLDKTISDEEYEKKLDELGERIHELGYQIYKKKIPFILAFEGWDAAGKGGAIKRIAYPLDPRDFEVIPVASPQPYEKARHFLWRFYVKLPKTGHIHIFDRTWYGRVMVERLEGFCAEDDWKRAYNEINEFEKELTDYGAVILKFWIQIDKDTQLARFTERQNTPEKSWKITDEDWRNREKWDAYEVAIDEMIEKTSTKAAPWHIVESVDKQYARIKVMQITADAMEEALKRNK